MKLKQFQPGQFIEELDIEDQTAEEEIKLKETKRKAKIIKFCE